MSRAMPPVHCPCNATRQTAAGCGSRPGPRAAAARRLLVVYDAVKSLKSDLLPSPSRFYPRSHVTVEAK